MPAAKPPEFRRRAVELARRRDHPIVQIAKDLGISEAFGGAARFAEPVEDIEAAGEQRGGA